MDEIQIKGYGHSIELCLSDDTDISELEDVLERRRSFFENTRINVSYSGKKLTYKEEMTLEKVIKRIFGEESVLEKKHRLSKAQIEYSLTEGEKICLVSNKSLRNGEVLESRGDIVVYGDVNPGATVKARGNITVIGALRGAAHIKGTGRVYATYMHPTQIKIGKVCSYNKNTENVGCAIAVAENGEIILERL